MSDITQTEKMYWHTLGVSAEAIDEAFVSEIDDDTPEQYDALAAPVIDAYQEAIDNAATVAGVVQDINETGLVSRTMVATIEEYLPQTLTARLPLQGYTIFPSKTGYRYAQELNVLELIVIGGLVAVFLKLTKSSKQRIDRVVDKSTWKIPNLVNEIERLTSMEQGLAKYPDYAKKHPEVYKHLTEEIADRNDGAVPKLQVAQMAQYAMNLVIRQSIVEASSDPLEQRLLFDAKFRANVIGMLKSVQTFGQSLVEQMQVFEKCMSANQPLPENFSSQFELAFVHIASKTKTLDAANQMKAWKDTEFEVDTRKIITLGQIKEALQSLGTLSSLELPAPDESFFNRLEGIKNRKASKENILAYTEAAKQLGELLNHYSVMVEAWADTSGSIGFLDDVIQHFVVDVSEVFGDDAYDELFGGYVHSRESYALKHTQEGIVDTVRGAANGFVEKFNQLKQKLIGLVDRSNKQVDCAKMVSDIEQLLGRAAKSPQMSTTYQETIDESFENFTKMTLLHQKLTKDAQYRKQFLGVAQALDGLAKSANEVKLQKVLADIKMFLDDSNRPTSAKQQYTLTDMLGVYNDFKVLDTLKFQLDEQLAGEEHAKYVADYTHALDMFTGLRSLYSNTFINSKFPAVINALSKLSMVSEEVSDALAGAVFLGAWVLGFVAIIFAAMKVSQKMTLSLSSEIARIGISATRWVGAIRSDMNNAVSWYRRYPEDYKEFRVGVYRQLGEGIAKLGEPTDPEKFINRYVEQMLQLMMKNHTTKFQYMIVVDAAYRMSLINAIRALYVYGNKLCADFDDLINCIESSVTISAGFRKTDQLGYGFSDITAVKTASERFVKDVGNRPDGLLTAKPCKLQSFEAMIADFVLLRGVKTPGISPAQLKRLEKLQSKKVSPELLVAYKAASSQFQTDLTEYQFVLTRLDNLLELLSDLTSDKLGHLYETLSSTYANAEIEPIEIEVDGESEWYTPYEETPEPDWIHKPVDNTKSIYKRFGTNW